MNNNAWDWLADTWWYVPTVYLPALEYQPSAEQPYVWLSDQTLWHLEMYRTGYVTGRVWAKLSSKDAEPTYSCTTSNWICYPRWECLFQLCVGFNCWSGNGYHWDWSYASER